MSKMYEKNMSSRNLNRCDSALKKNIAAQDPIQALAERLVPVGSLRRFVFSVLLQHIYVILFQIDFIIDSL